MSTQSKSTTSMNYSLRWTPRQGRHRFYKLSVQSARVSARYGVVGGAGRLHERRFDDALDARKDALTKLRTRLNHGYHLVTDNEGTGKPTRLPAPPVQRMLDAVRRARKLKKKSNPSAAPKSSSSSSSSSSKKRTHSNLHLDNGEQDVDDDEEDATPAKRVRTTTSVGVQTDDVITSEPRPAFLFSPGEDRDADEIDNDDIDATPAGLIAEFRGGDDLPPAPSIVPNDMDAPDDGGWKAKLHQAELTIAQLEHDKTDLETKLHELSRSEQQLRLELQEQTHQLEHTRRTFSDQIDQMNLDHTAQLTETRTHLHNEICQLRSTVDELQDGNSRRGSEIAERTRHATELEIQRKRLDDDLVATRELLQIEVRHREEQERALSSRQHELDEKQRQLEIKDRDMRARILRAVEEALGVAPLTESSRHRDVPARDDLTPAKPDIADNDNNNDNNDDDCCILPAPTTITTPPPSLRKSHSRHHRPSSTCPTKPSSSRRILDLDSLLSAGNIPCIDLSSLESTESDVDELTLNIRGIEVMFRVPGGGAQPVDLPAMAAPSPSCSVGVIEAS